MAPLFGSLKVQAQKIQETLGTGINLLGRAAPWGGPGVKWHANEWLTKEVGENKEENERNVYEL